MSAVLAPVESTQPAAPWRLAALALAAVWLALGLLYADTVATMVGIWYRSETFAHAFLVPPISAWLIWRLRGQLARISPSPQPWLLLGLVVAAAGWLLADLVKVNSVSQLAWVAMLILSVPAVLGLAVASTILFPLLFLFFAVPLGEFMLPYMMSWTADFTILALRLSGIPVYREGLQFVIPSGSWSVIEACSGVRYLIASFMVGALFAYLNYSSTKRRVIFMLASLLIPIVANWLRAYMIVMLGHLSGNTIAVGVDHLLYGWVFFGLVVMLMFYVGGRWSEPDPQRLDAANQTPALPSTQRPLAFVLTGVAAIAILALPLLAHKALDAGQGPAGETSLALPAQPSPGWRQAEPSGTEFKPTFVNPSAELNQAFAGPQGDVGVYLAYYRGQSPSRKLVSSVNFLVASEDKNWNQIATGAREMQLGGRTLPWRTAVILGKAAGTSPRHLVAWRVYWVDGRWIASDVRAQLAGALGRLLGHGDDGAALVLYARSETPELGHKRLEVFVQDNLAAIEATLQARRAAR
jgi:exosortase A